MKGVRSGATKPFDMLELLACIEALVQRRPGAIGSLPTIHQFGAVRVDLRGTQVWRDGKPVPLLPENSNCKRYFIEHRGATLSRKELLKEVWGYELSTSTRTIDVHVARLRQKT